MLLSAALAIVASGVVVFSTATVTKAAIRDPFTTVYEAQQNGAVTLIGNSQMTCPTNANGCTSARSAAPLTSGNNDAINNEYNMQFLDLDGATFTTTNSTSADLALPSGSVVLFAMLVWGGRRDAGTVEARPGRGLQPN